MHGSIHLFERLPQVDASTSAENDAEGFATPLQRSRPLVGVIRNPRSHRNENGDALVSGHEGVIITAPRKRSELPAILSDFASRRVDCIAIDGGDGTVRDVLTCGAGIFGDCWPTLVILPNGKTNALAYDLGIPVGWPLEDALEAIRQGRMVRRRPLVISQRDDENMQVRGFVLGAGVFNNAISLGQRSHDLGAFNAATVGVTAAWSLLQALFGSGDNPWRRGTKMRLRNGEGEELPHFGGLPADERYLLLASTLESFPAGIDPFRKVQTPLQLAILDNPRRSLLLRMGALMRGTAGETTMHRGAHAIGGDSFEIDIDSNFILDGEAFPPGHYRLTAGTKLRFVVP